MHAKSYISFSRLQNYEFWTGSMPCSMLEYIVCVEIVGLYLYLNTIVNKF